MVYKVDGNPQIDSRDWSMYSNILKRLKNKLEVAAKELVSNVERTLLEIILCQ